MARHASTTLESPPVGASLRDYVALTKPRITLMVVLTAAGGIWLAPTVTSAPAALAALALIACVVGAANSLNCWLERDVDRLMRRTMNRPLPASRLAPRPALAFGLVMGLFSIPALALLANPVTGLLGALAFAVYVGAYTPLKQITPAALLIGAVPGAMPPLMGWTAATGSVAWPGLALFGVLFLWQLPHFIAIGVYREDEYTRAGLKVLSAIRGPRAAHRHAVVYAALLVPVAASPWPLGVAGPLYGAVALAASLAFLGLTVRDLRPSRGRDGARRVFLASVIYLPLVVAALMVDVALMR